MGIKITGVPQMQALKDTLRELCNGVQEPARTFEI